MTRKQAVRIVKMHDYHIKERTKARQLGDQESVEEHQRCLTLMRTDYDKACSLLLKLSK